MLKRVSYLFIAISLLVTGCTLEQKLAKSFVKLEPPCQFLLLEPDFLYKYNLKTFEIPGIDTMDDYTKDSLLLANSLFLKDISDSVLISEFNKSFVKTLELYKAVVLPESAVDTVMQNGGKPYILNVAQFSLEEFLHPYSSEEMVYDEILVIDGFDVNAINFNIWIELGRMNTEKNNKVLFESDYMIDDINGTLKQNLFTGKVIFDYTIDTISIPGVYEFAGEFGEKTAYYIYDYVMNSFIRENLPENYPFVPYYYHYDPVRKILYAVDEDQRILELESK
jgi:hypothetical protein